MMLFSKIRFTGKEVRMQDYQLPSVVVVVVLMVLVQNSMHVYHTLVLRKSSKRHPSLQVNALKLVKLCKISTISQERTTYTA